MWSLGVITYMALYGEAPFTDSPLRSPDSPMLSAEAHARSPLSDAHRAPETLDETDDNDDVDWNASCSVSAHTRGQRPSPLAVSSAGPSATEGVEVLRVSLGPAATDVATSAGGPSLHLSESSDEMPDSISRERSSSLDHAGDILFFGVEGRNPFTHNGDEAAASSTAAAEGSRTLPRPPHLSSLQVAVPIPLRSSGSAQGVSRSNPDSPTLERKNALLARSSRGLYSFPGGTDVSQSARNFISRLLQVDPTSRLSAPGALEHRWLLVARAETSRRPVVHTDPDGVAIETGALGSGARLCGAPPPQRCARRQPAGMQGAWWSGNASSPSEPIAPEGALADGAFALPLQRRSPLTNGTPPLTRYAMGEGGRSEASDHSRTDGHVASDDGNRSTPEGTRLISKGFDGPRGFLPYSSSDDDGSDDDRLSFRRAGAAATSRGSSNDSSQRMVRPPVVPRALARRHTTEGF